MQLDFACLGGQVGARKLVRQFFVLPHGEHHGRQLWNDLISRMFQILRFAQFKLGIGKIARSRQRLAQQIPPFRRIRILLQRVFDLDGCRFGIVLGEVFFTRREHAFGTAAAASHER